MRNNKALLLFFFICLSVFSQQKITTEEIYSGLFRTKDLFEFKSLKKSNQYTVLSNESQFGTKINLHDFGSLKKITTLLDTNKSDVLSKGIQDYTFSDDEKLILIINNKNYIYRNSYFADYYLYDINSKKTTKLFNQVQEATFSPDGSKIAYVKSNNIYIYDIDKQTTTEATNDGKKNYVINGITDWVYEEEFKFVRAFEWSPDGKKIAYIRFDETDVKEYSMDVYGKENYPKVVNFKYPKAGENNAKVSLRVYDTEKATTKNIALSNYDDFYIPRIKWTNENMVFSAQILNRQQNNLDLVFIDSETGISKIALTEKDKAYVDVHDNLRFLKDNSFFWTSERDGYNHIYYYSKAGKLIEQMTNGKWDVTEFYGFDEKSRTLFIQSTEEGIANRALYKIGFDNKFKFKLSREKGTNNAIFSPNYHYFINDHSTANSPNRISLYSTKDSKELIEIVNNDDLSLILKKYSLPAKEFLDITTENGNSLSAFMIKPKDFDNKKKYPVLMYQYSGPGSQEVTNKWLDTNDYWFMMLSQQGYIIICVDGRGTGFRGADFKKVTQKQLGKYEVEDQIYAAKIISTYPYVDKSRIGIFGWSYGGYVAASSILKGADVFKMAIAVAPVTDWRLYDTIYTERYMQSPIENKSGYDDNAPLNFANKLRGDNLLIVHGSGDDNVHFQNSAKFIDALIKAKKQFDWLVYPDKNHGIYGGYTRVHLYDKMTKYIKEKL
jgi:dipeptidyl-peptidase 4